MSLRCGVDDGEAGDREAAGDGEDGARRRAVWPGHLDRAPRRALVLELLCHELTYVEMAALLDVSPATVKMHLRTIYRQLGVRGAVGAVALWRAIMEPDLEIAQLARPLLNPDEVDDADGVDGVESAHATDARGAGRW